VFTLLQYDYIIIILIDTRQYMYEVVFTLQLFFMIMWI